MSTFLKCHDTNAWLQLNNLDNNGCFYNQQVIKFLAELGAAAPEIYYGTYTGEMTEALNEIVMEVLEGTTSVSTGYLYFGMVIQHYRQLDPPILQLLQIEIETEPNKTEYVVGETFDPAGMVVTATYSDGSTAEVTEYTYSPNGALTDSDNSITISYTEGGATETATQEIAVYPTANVYYGDNLAPSVDERNLQSMDIYIPKNADGTYKAGLFPAVITIHGGGWCDGDKATSHYHNNTDNNNDMSDFITNTCNCVHVNMNYRLTTGDPSNNGITYVQMLEDIQSVISYLQNHANVYHINPGKIALMGYSAGGHLALLYAYSTADNYTNPNDNPIKLVISEAGPTYFYKENEELEGQDEIITDENICAMVGIGYKAESNEYNNNELTALWNASPLKYATSNSPYTILAYGNGLPAIEDKYGDENGNSLLDDGDGFLPYSQAALLEGLLNPTSSQVGGGTGDNASQIIEGDNCTLFKLFEVEHGQFGEGGKVYPGSITDSENLTQAVSDYYNKISAKLQELNEQENN